MKKLLTAALAGISVFSLLTIGGCSQNDDDRLVMATNAEFPPFEYVNSDGEYEGIDVEIAEAIASKLGKELKIENMKFEDILDGVQSNKYDFGMAAMTVKPDRMEKVNFSDTYAKGIQAVIVKSDSGYSKFEEFYDSFDSDGNPAQVKSGIKIGVQKGTTGESYSSADPDDWGFGSNNVAKYESGEEAIKALINGKITAVIIDNEPAKTFVGENEGLMILEGAYADEDYAICVSKDNSKLLGQINQAVAELQEDGTIDGILNKYIKR
ncbi:MAG: ABC transporter substrate-binding protein [[Eubacterium] siraeum]|nr:ABC transporter substrate-binding protein [[Eubacterium] siraeum]